MTDTKIWLIGAGLMGIEYAKVLQHLNHSFTVIGRGASSAESFKTNTGLDARQGGLDQWLPQKPSIPEHAIVAVNVEDLAAVTEQLLDYGVRHIFLEKPGGASLQQLERLHQKAQQLNAQIYLAYNRRYYASTLQALEMIKEDGGVTSFSFEFTEWCHVIDPARYPEEVLRQWFLANSSHVADLAFFLGGYPVKWQTYTAGQISWHPAAAIFAGAGISDKNALFSYQANWAAPGRWGVEILTSKHRLYFRPMEKLQIQKIGSVALEFVPLDDQWDQQFKPGFYQQTQTFLDNKPSNHLCPLEEQVKAAKFYQQIVSPHS